MKKWLLVTAGLLLVLSLGVGAYDEAASEEVMLGYVHHLSGPAAPWGIPAAQGAKICVDDINSEGGYWDKAGFSVGGKNYRWRLFVEDCAYKPNIAVQAVHRLIYAHDVHFIIMHGGSVSAAAAPIIHEKGDVLFGICGGVGKEVINRLTFKFMPMPPDVNAPGLYEAMRDREGVKTVAIIVPSDETGQTWLAGAVPAAQELGIKVVAQESYQRDIQDFYPLLTRVLAKNPDMLDVSYGISAGQMLMFKQAYEMGFRGVKVAFNLDPDKLVTTAGKEAAEGVYNWNCNPRVVTDFQKWFESEFVSRHYEWNPLAMPGGDTFYALTKAIEAAQSLDVLKVADALENVKWESYYGPCHFSGEEHWGIKRQALMPVFVDQVKDGKAVYAFVLPAPEKW